MEKCKIEFVFERKSPDELTAGQREAVEAAFLACKGSYSPYSRFLVGAAVEMSDGEMLSASNQENASFPLGQCAERTALFYAKAKRPGEGVKRIAVAAMRNGAAVKTPVPPCGACRQVMSEMSKRQETKIELIMAGADACIVVDDVNRLLPLQFGAEDFLR